MAKPSNDEQESLVCMASALRQVAGTDIEESDFMGFLQTFITGSSDTYIGELLGKSTKIRTDEVKKYFDVPKSVDLKKMPGLMEENRDWLKSCVLVANKLFKDKSRSKLNKGDYIFYHSKSYSSFKGNFKDLMNEVKSNNTENNDIGLVFGQGISEDKWNPADIIAVATNYDNKKEYDIKKKPQGKLIESLQRLNDRDAKKKAEAVSDMAKLYEYNLWVDENYIKGNIVPISLKKATSIPKIEIYRQSKSDVFKSFLDMKVNVTKVEYKESNQKCIIHFDILTPKNKVVNSLFFDARGFESSKINADVQIQIQKAGGSANYGKIALPMTELIAKLSKGNPAFTKMQQMRKKAFAGAPRETLSTINSIPSGFFRYGYIDDILGKNPSDLTDYTVNYRYFIDYIVALHPQNKDALERWLRTKATTLLEKRKYIKNKVQSFEVGYLLDTSSGAVQKIVQENITKSIYLYAASKGLYIFGEDKEVKAFMQSSTFIKVGT